jgi:hypothetical protein
MMADNDPAPAAPSASAPLKLAPRQLYYLAIDGTNAIDSVRYGELLETKYGWRNLCTDFLKAATDDPNRLDDPEHPYVPICLYNTSNKKRKIAVISPCGRDSKGNDPFWLTYGETGAPDGHKVWDDPDQKFETWGRHTAAERTARIIEQLMLQASAETITKPTGEVYGCLPGELEADPWIEGERRYFRADLLIVSSHGWLGGFMRGNVVAAQPTAQPEKARADYNPTLPFFTVGKVAAKLRGFIGPRWVILAQCSTINSATWPLWSRVLAASTPGIRGILAYEEVSPGPEGSVTIANAFFEAAQKKSLLEAWKEANAGQKWSALVHQDALDDKIRDWRSFGELKEKETTGTTGPYLGFLHGIKGGTPVRDVAPPFEAHLWMKLPKEPPDTPYKLPWETFMEVTPESFGRPWTRIIGDFWYRLRIAAPSGDKIVKATIRWIHIRPTHATQVKPKKLWAKIMRLLPTSVKTLDEDPNVTITLNDQDVFATWPAPEDAVDLAFNAVGEAALAATGIELHHAYFWPHIDITLASGKTISHDFKIVGLLY